MSEIDAGNLPLTDAPPGGLRAHLKLWLDLAGVIRSVMELFHEAKDPREYQARRLLSCLAEDRFGPPEKAHASLLRCIERTITLLAPEQIEGRAGEAAARLKGEALGAMRREWEDRMRQIETEYLCIVETLQGRVRSEMSLRFEHAIAEHCNEVRDTLAAQVDLFLAGRRGKPIAAKDLRELADRAGGVSDERRGRWLSAHQREFVETLWMLSSETVDRLERLYDEALEFAASLSGTHPPGPRWTMSKDETNFSWRAATPLEWRPRFAWELDVLPVRWVRRRVRQDYGRTLEAAVDVYCGRVAQGLAVAGGVWIGRLTSEVQDALRDIDTRMKGALSGRAASAFSGYAGALLSRLGTMRQELNDKGPDKSSPLSPIPTRRRLIRQCLICERIESELFDFFSKRQYELSINEAGRPADAPISRFCPLHTWQYARISSPPEISLSYAPLLAATARTLRSIATSASSPLLMVDRIRDLYPSAAKCPACRKVVEVEEAAVEQFRQISLNGDEEADGGLCVRHLGAVLNRETDLEVARNLVFEQADVLDRISEDMQAFSLKHDAVRRELATGEELTAYLFGLSILVGHRGLS